MLEWLKSLLKGPEPAGPPELIRSFGASDPTITQGTVEVDQDGWVLDSREVQTIRLFEVQEPGAEQCMITYRAQLKAESLNGRAYLEMWCRLPGRGEFFSKGLHQAVKGTTDWVFLETPFYLKRGQRPDLIKLNLVIEGEGRVRLRKIELLKTSLR